MYATQYIHYLQFPPVPESILSKISLDPKHYGLPNAKSIFWTDQENQELNAWCQEHICPTMYFAFQLFPGDVALHKDRKVSAKLNFILATGGDAVRTEFFDDDKTTLLGSYVIQPKRWHILKSDPWHHVVNLEPGKVRVAITGQVFDSKIDLPYLKEGY